MLTPLNTNPSSVDVVTKPQFTHPQLLSALYYMWDAFDRALMPMFLCYDTAKSVINKGQLSGESIHVGVRENDWRSGSRAIVDAFAPIYEERLGYNLYYFKDIPIYLHILPEAHCIKSTNIVLYQQEYFRLPNPYNEFEKLFGTTWKE